MRITRGKVASSRAFQRKCCRVGYTQAKTQSLNDLSEQKESGGEKNPGQMNKRHLAVILKNLRSSGWWSRNNKQMRTIIREINKRGFSTRIQNVAAAPRWTSTHYSWSRMRN